METASISYKHIPQKGGPLILFEQAWERKNASCQCGAIFACRILWGARTQSARWLGVEPRIPKKNGGAAPSRLAAAGHVSARTAGKKEKGVE